MKKISRTKGNSTLPQTKHTYIYLCVCCSWIWSWFNLNIQMIYSGKAESSLMEQTPSKVIIHRPDRGV